VAVVEGWKGDTTPIPKNYCKGMLSLYPSSISPSRRAIDVTGIGMLSSDFIQP
jgi:hypothetical protein